MQRRPYRPTGDLFDGADPGASEVLADGAWVLRGYAAAHAPVLLAEIAAIAAAAAPRHLIVPGGKRMSVAMTNCGALGWVSDTRGYRYEPCDPQSGKPWPAMPASLLSLAREAADAAGYAGFAPDASLCNFYQPGARMSLHRDHDEGDLAAPIVSISLGLPATFLWGGLARADRARRLRLVHGDVVVWGGASRLVHHGVAPLAEGEHPLSGRWRYNLTFRKAR
ncbi:DNA oxidative demethylase AlkB [Hydrocarboniphaga sp.]|uniref:DNA oxidative demethylase AlkB n=1 Tax=Hydrocarboniphaga sp. TaxID=2033016 RepID=UPI0034517B0D